MTNTTPTADSVENMSGKARAQDSTGCQDCTAQVAIIGGGVVGVATAFTLAHHGVDTVLLEAQPELGMSASGTNSGVLHTGFDSTPGQLETDLIVRAAKIRPAIMEALQIPVLKTGAALIPHQASDHEVINDLRHNAQRNGVEVTVRKTDGALLIPGEWVTDPVAFTRALAASAQTAGARIRTDARVTGIDPGESGATVTLHDGSTVRAQVVVNAAGLYADEIAGLVGDDSFTIYPRKGEFFVFDAPDGQPLEEILLPVPTKRTKGVLVFPTLDGHITTGPTADDGQDKENWSVRPEARHEVLNKAFVQCPRLEGHEPIFSYAGLRPAGVGTNYVIGPSAACPRLINVAAIRSTGLSASLAIGEYVSGFLPSLGVALGAAQPVTIPDGTTPYAPNAWWKRTAEYRAANQGDAGEPS